MEPSETVQLCRFVKACCPQQAIDEYTPDAWHLHLAKYRYEDAKQAAVHLTQRQPFIQIAELVSQIRTIRSKRISDAGDLTPPPGLGVIETNHWLAGARSRIGDGEDPATVQGDYGELKPRHLPDLRALMPGPSDA